jgi:phosphatidyl-myo-inositol dimannoside synthase
VIEIQSPLVTGSRTLAVPLLGERGGGVGQASALFWEAMLETWSDDAVCIPLLPSPRPSGRTTPGIVDKLRFGTHLGTRQMFGLTRWILFSHLGLARAQRFVPTSRRVPYAIFLHGVEAWQPMVPEDILLLQNATLRLANSEVTARRARAANPGIGEVLVCPLGLAEGAENTRPGAAPPIEQRRSVLVVGRMSQGERYKGHDELIDVWPDVVAAIPDAELVIAGDGDDRVRLESRAKASRAGDRIRFVGFVDRDGLAAQYARAALFALPSRGEGFGLVYLEAMAHRLPCLGSPHDAAREVIEHGTTGLLADPQDRVALGAALIELLKDGELRRRLGESGYQRLLERFTFDRFQRRLIDLLRASFEVATKREASLQPSPRTP